jgi:malonyl CoA-acyl carrier protein transacylase
MALTRIYVVQVKESGAVVKLVLVRAPNAAQAARHVTRQMVSVEVASQEELVNLLGQGVKVEHAGEGE